MARSVDTLKLTQADDPGAAVSTSPHPPLRTLIIEQERTPCEALARVIDAEPDLCCVGSGGPQVGLDLGPTDVDVALLAAQVPGIDVVAAASLTRQRFPHARLVVLSGYVDHELADAAATAGADAVVDTSISLEDLLHVLRTGLVRNAEPGTAPSHGRDHHSGKLAEDLGITPRQYEVLRQLAKGHSADQVARSLQIKVATCRDHIKALHRVLDCSSTIEMVVASSRLGLLPELGRPYR
jgi:DNA-binding NarL/FixJ family response regulator